MGLLPCCFRLQRDLLRNQLPQGFEVTLFDPAAGLNGKQLLAATSIKEFVDQFDADRKSVV